MHATRRAGPSGFTLVELLVVITIIALISAVALPTVLPALNERRISESARLLQAILAGSRDAAIRANAPRGIRLLPDPVFSGGPVGSGQALASNRIIPIELGPDYTEGLVGGQGTVGVSALISNTSYLRIGESGFTVTSGVNVPNNPTSWFNNIRQGDKIRFNDSGPYYTIAGPIDLQIPGQTQIVNGKLTAINPERFIRGSTFGSPTAPLSFQTGWVSQYLNLTNGLDDNGNGWIDEGCDGIDNDGDGIIDPGFNGQDDNGDGVIDDAAELHIGLVINGEFEQEVFIGAQASLPPVNEPYTIFRRPVVSPGAREVTLPPGIVIDLTTWDASFSGFGVVPERSRLPVDAYTGYVDIVIDQSGRVVTPGAGSAGGGAYTNSPLSSSPFYHFWLTEREGVATPTVGAVTNPLLPMPKGTPNYSGTTFLTGERRLVTLFVKTGQITSNSIPDSVPNLSDPTRPIGSFNGLDVNYPFYDAQSGTKEPQ